MQASMAFLSTSEDMSTWLVVELVTTFREVRCSLEISELFDVSEGHSPWLGETKKFNNAIVLGFVKSRQRKIWTKRLEAFPASSTVSRSLHDTNPRRPLIQHVSCRLSTVSGTV